MTANDRAQFLEIVVGFAELKGRALSAPALELYWHAMSAWPLEDFKQAAEHLLSRCEFMPTPKDFEDLRRAGRPTAAEAWAVVLAYVRTGSYDRSRPRINPQPEPSPLAQRVVATLGGYVAIAKSPEEYLHLRERSFCERYEEMQDASDVREALPQIARDERGELTRDFAPAGQLARALQHELAATLQPKQPANDRSKPQ
jgi:hypothetical protein